MCKLLYITSHPLNTEDSKSLKTGQIFLEEWEKKNPGAEVIRLNLFEAEIPVLDKNIFEIWAKVKAGVSFDSLTEIEQEKVRVHNKLINEFINADKIVFVNPMWNHFFPPVMKQYIDVLCVAGKTFKYTPDGPLGLLGDKKVLHIQSAGGTYNHENGEIVDFGSEYLKHMMNFFGINNFSSVYIEGADAFPDKKEEILALAAEEARKTAESF
jgi:FMN-dependent NADH-azoreductase